MNGEFMDQMREAGSEATSDYREEWSSLEGEYGQLADEFRDRVRSIFERRSELSREIRERLHGTAQRLGRVEISVDPRTTESDGDLFDSTRDYFEQNEHYQKRKAEKARWFSNDRIP